MVKEELSVSKTQQVFSLGDLPFADILSPYIHKGEGAFSTYWFRRGEPVFESFRVDLDDAGSFCLKVFDPAKDALSLPAETFPYGLTASQWRDYAISPHSYLSVGDGIFQIGLNYFNRFMHLDVQRSEVCLLDPGVGGDFLSTTNFFDEPSNEVWFASWSALDTICRNTDPQAGVDVRIWKIRPDIGRPALVWRGNFADSVHQVAVNPDKTFLIAAELGLRTDFACGKQNLVPSSVLFLNLETGRDWRFEMPAAAHVEFDPSDPSVCYLSGHNIGFVGSKVGIFGPGVIQKVRLTPKGPKTAGSFSHPSFHRITTHLVFNGQGKTLIAVSGYPGSIFLVDAASMALFKILVMDADDPVETSCGPHVCSRDSYGICVSDDGKYLLALATGALRVFDLDTGDRVREQGIEGNCSFTGHAALVQNVSGSSR